jgi:hypothetical protein
LSASADGVYGIIFLAKIIYHFMIGFYDFPGIYHIRVEYQIITGVFRLTFIYAVRQAASRYVSGNDRAGGHNRILANDYGAQDFRAVGDYYVFSNYRRGNVFPFMTRFVKPHICANRYILKNNDVFTNFRSDNSTSARVMGKQHALVYFCTINFTAIELLQQIAGRSL